jgi:hypothetical protein
MIDLHLHSNYSDGLFSVNELTDMVKKSHLDFCSLTDHDTVDGVEEFSSKLNGRSRVIPGVELTALFNKREIHVLAYDFDVATVKRILKKRNQIIEKQKVKELDISKKLFSANGFEVDNLLKIRHNQPVGLTIALDVYNNNKNQEKLLRRHGKKISSKEFYDLYQSPSAPCFVPRSGVDIKWILKNFNGVAKNLILAHPFNPVSFLVPPLTLNEIDSLVKLGIDGIEIYHPGLNRRQIDILEKFVFERDLKFTGGSDFHGKDKNQKIAFYSKKTPIKYFKLYGLSNNK